MPGQVLALTPSFQDAGPERTAMVSVVDGGEGYQRE